MNSKTKTHIILYGLIAIESAIHLYIPLKHGPFDHLWSDWLAYWQLALNPITIDFKPMTQSMFYPFWLSWIARITNGDVFLISFYSGLLSCLTPWIWYRFLREILKEKQFALIGWSMLGFLPSWIGIFQYFAAETLLLPLTGLSLWFTWRAKRKKSIESLVWAELSWLITALTKPTVLPIMVMSFIWMIGKIDSLSLKKMWITLFLSSIILVPFGYRVYKLTGSFRPFGNQIYGTIYYNSGKNTIRTLVYSHHNLISNYWNTSPSLFLKPFHPFTTWPNFRQGEYFLHIDTDHLNESWAVACKETKPSFAQAMRNKFENIIYIFFGTTWPNENENSFWDSLSNSFRWVWFPLVLLQFVVVCKDAKRRKQLPILGLFNSVSWIAIATLPVCVAEGRYRLPFEGLLIATLLFYIEQERLGNYFFNIHQE